MKWFRRDGGIIDDARRDDAAALADIHERSFSRGWSAEEMSSFLGEYPVVQGIAFRRRSLFGSRRRVVGFVLLRMAGGEAEILTIAVDPSSRGRGHGRRLMEEAARRAYRDRVEALFLEVEESNRAAVGLYLSLGFRKVGERSRYYRHADGEAGNALVLRLSLR
ncbi:MAG: ribosomal protein S18-alanine N-acetyltransferase [Bauldia sp.]|nr:ribosomal protein S18-alanine N-acetyltransferase [Bauldia sp.]